MRWIAWPFVLVGRLILRAYWRLAGVGYTCDECGGWMPRGAGKAYVKLEEREVRVIPSLPREPRQTFPDGVDPKGDAMIRAVVREIKSGIAAKARFTTLRCPRCAYFHGQ